MACERPLILPNPKGGTLQAICGTCRSCLIQDIKDWTIRLENENKHCFNGYFVTLTYSDEYNDGNLHKEHLQEFVKNMRNADQYNRSKALTNIPRIKYFGVGEYGEHYERPHYHLILFNTPAANRDKAIKFIQDAWRKGFIVVDEVNRTTIQYVCKYIFKQKHHQSKKQRPFRLMSTRPAIGENYLKTHSNWHLEGEIYYSQDEDKKVHLPRYYSDRILDDEYKERRKDKARDHSAEERFKAMTREAEENVQLGKLKLIREEQQNESFTNKMNKSKLN